MVWYTINSCNKHPPHFSFAVSPCDWPWSRHFWVVVVVVVWIYRDDDTVLSFSAVTLMLIFKASLRPSIRNLSSVVQSCMVWGPGCTRAPHRFMLSVHAQSDFSPRENWPFRVPVAARFRPHLDRLCPSPGLGQTLRQVSFVSHISLCIQQISLGVCPRSFR